MERHKKIEVAKEKLEAYQKQKSPRSKSSKCSNVNSESASASDFSFSISVTPPLLPDKQDDNENNDLNVYNSDSDTIAENIEPDSLSNSEFENDRSLQEIDIPNLQPDSFDACFPSTSNAQRNISSESFNHSEVAPNSTKEDSSGGGSFYLHNSNLKSEHLEVSETESSLHPSNDFKSNNSSSNESKYSLQNVECLLQKENKNQENMIDEHSLESTESSLQKINEEQEMLEQEESTKIKQLEELLAGKDAALAALSAELDSLKEASSHLSTVSMGTVSTEYKQLAEEYKSKFIEYQEAITQRETVILQLRESLKETLQNKHDLQEQAKQLSHEVTELRSQISKTTEYINAHDCSNSKDIEENQPQKIVSDKYQSHLEEEFTKLEKVLNPTQVNNFQNFKRQIVDIVSLHIADNKNIETKQTIEKLQNEKLEYVSEVTRLYDLKKELEEKHEQEMKELRLYFEKKCSDLEKNYSEEVFSQHSRKFSESNSISENEVASDLIYSGPPALPTINDTQNPEDHVEVIKSELEEKYKQEISEIKNEYENKVEKIMENNDNVLLMLENKYEEQIESLKNEVESLKADTCKEPVVESGGSSVEELIFSYELRIKEQIELARIDLITSLKVQIQRLISGEDTAESQWPMELVQVRNVFVKWTEDKLEAERARHAIELEKLRKSNERFIVRSAEREKRRSQEIMAQISLDGSQDSLVKERDNLKVVNQTMKHIIHGLIKYINACEEELNNTLLEEVLKEYYNCDDMLADGNDLNSTIDSEKTDDFNNSQISRKKKVHFTPDVSGILNFIEKQSQLDCTDGHLSINIDSELKNSLERLKLDAEAILCMSTNIKLSKKDTSKMSLEYSKSLKDELNQNKFEEKLKSLNQKLIDEAQEKNNIKMQLIEYKSNLQQIELERQNLKQQINDMKEKEEDVIKELYEAKNKIIQLVNENERKEIVSEGYGESGITPLGPLESPRETLTQAIERAQILLHDGNADINVTEALTLVESLCSAGRRAEEDANKKNYDLQLQEVLQMIQRICCQKVEAADKKLRSNTRFLEEQAGERESERDEAQRQIEELKLQLANYEKEFSAAQHITAEVESLEQQMREISARCLESEGRNHELEMELKESCDKMIILRDIIREMETQVEAKNLMEGALKVEIAELKATVASHMQNNAKLEKQLNSFSMMPDNEKLIQHAAHLETELGHYKEFGSLETLVAVRTQLRDMENLLIKRTKDLETFVSSMSCSSPSEDISVADTALKHIRDQPNCGGDGYVDVLELVRRTTVAMQRHARAEETVVKRNKDLEMQFNNSRKAYENIQLERDALQDRLTEHLTEISSLQMRLEEQRRLLQTVTKQSNMSLETKIFDLENEVRTLKETVHARDKQIRQLNSVLEKTKKRINDAEIELSSLSDGEKEIIVKLQTEINKLEVENSVLKSKIEEQDNTAFPNLVEQLLSEKSADIERLHSKIGEQEKRLEFYNSLNLDDDVLRHLSQSFRDQTEGKSSARTLSDVVSISEFDDGDFKMRRAEISPRSLQSFDISNIKKNTNETTVFEPRLHVSNQNETCSKNQSTSYIPAPEISAIPYIEPKIDEDNETSEKCQRSLSEKRVRFDDLNMIEILKSEIFELKNQLDKASDKILEYEKQLDAIPTLESKIDDLEKDIENHNLEKQNLIQQFDTIKISEITLKTDLDDVKQNLSDKQKELNIIKEDIIRRDNMLLNITKEKQDLQRINNQLQEKILQIQDYEILYPEKEAEIEMLEGKLKNILENQSSEIGLNIDILQNEIKDLNMKYQDKIAEVNISNNKVKDLEEKLTFEKSNNQKLSKDLENQISQNKVLLNELEFLKNQLDEKEKVVESLQDTNSSNSNRIKNLEEKVIDQKCEIDILNEDISDIQESHSEASSRSRKEELKRKNSIIQKNQIEISHLQQEVMHLQEFLKEKDKIINQMSEDSRSLHIALETIQNKMQETGNIVDLAKKYKDEQQLTQSLQNELRILKSTLNRIETSSPQICELEEITDQVQKELNYSAQLDSNILSVIEEKTDQNLKMISDTHNMSENSTPIKKRLQKVDNFNIEVPPIENALNSQLSSLVDDVSKLQGEVDTLKKQLEEKAKMTNELNSLKESLALEIKEIEAKFELEKENCEHLKVLLDVEKKNSTTIQLQDANIIETMRIRLEAALDTETELEKCLENERQVREDLNNKLKNLQQQLEIEVNPEIMIQESVKRELEKLCNEKQELKYERDELKSQLKKKEEQLENIKSKYGVLKSEITNLKKSNTELYKSVGELNQEIEKLRVLKKKNEEEEENLMSEENPVVLKKKIAQKEKEVEFSRQLITEIDTEKRHLKSQLENVREELNEAKNRLEQEKELQLKSPVPAKFLQKLQEVKNLLADHVRENKKMSDTLAELTEERRSLQTEVAQLKLQNSTDADAEERTNHLFGRFLRAESYRKALAYQKQYLLILLHSYELNGSPSLPAVTTYSHTRKSKKMSFRCAAIILIAIHRMQYLVQRWHTGKRIGGKAWSHQGFTSSHNLNLPLRPPTTNNNLHSNSSVSQSLQFMNDPGTPRRTSSHHNSSWFGQSPPCRDKSENHPSQYSNSQINAPSSPLISPAFVSPYIERFEQIQRSIDLTSSHSSNQ